MAGANRVIGGDSGRRFSDHSVRKTGISKLLDNGMSPHFVCQLSGHKLMDSLKNYHTASDNQQKMMSDILSNKENVYFK